MKNVEVTRKRHRQRSKSDCQFSRRKNIARDRIKKLQNTLKVQVEKNDDGIPVKKSETSPKFREKH